MSDKWGIRNALFGAKKRISINDLRGKSGIYRIVNIVNGHHYVGQSKDLLNRRRCHFEALRKNRHGNSYLQHAYNHYGEPNFYFEVIEYVPDLLSLNDREQYWIEKTNPEYNLMRNVFELPKVADRARINQALELSNHQEETFTRPDWHAWVYGGQRKPR